jgi:hypothetical protein
VNANWGLEMRTAFLVLFLGCTPVFAQDPGAWAAQQAAQQAMDASAYAAQQANDQMMQAAATANAQAMQAAQLANQFAMQQAVQSSQDPRTNAVPSGVTRQPVFSVKPGTVSAGTKVRIKCFTRFVLIYYTTDGTAPTFSSPLYRGAIRINSSLQLKAMAVGPDMWPSSIADIRYTVAAPTRGTGHA